MSLSAYCGRKSLGLEYGGGPVNHKSWDYQYLQVTYHSAFIENPSLVSPYYSFTLGQSWASAKSRYQFPYLGFELGMGFDTKHVYFELGYGIAFLAMYIPFRVLLKINENFSLGPVVNYNSLFGAGSYWSAGGIIRYSF